MVQFEKPLDFPLKTKLKVMLVMNHSGSDNGRSNTQLGRCRLSLTRAPGPRAQPVDYSGVLAIQIATRETHGEATGRDLRRLAENVANRSPSPSRRRSPPSGRSIRLVQPPSCTCPSGRRTGTGDEVSSTGVSGIGRSKTVKPHVPAPSSAGKERQRPTGSTFARWLVEQPLSPGGPGCRQSRVAGDLWQRACGDPRGFRHSYAGAGIPRQCSTGWPSISWSTAGAISI